MPDKVAPATSVNDLPLGDKFILRRKMCILAAKICILAAKIYILPAEMYILAAKTHILAAKMKFDCPFKQIFFLCLRTLGEMKSYLK